jgi:hypothetical protein
VTIFSNGYRPNADTAQNGESQLQLFCDHLPVLRLLSVAPILSFVAWIFVFYLGICFEVATGPRSVTLVKACSETRPKMLSRPIQRNILPCGRVTDRLQCETVRVRWKSHDCAPARRAPAIGEKLMEDELSMLC